MKKIVVNLNKKYSILIEKEIFNKAGEHIKKITRANKICIISDSNVYPLYGEKLKENLQKEGFEVFDFIFEAGEKSKVINTVIGMVEFMAQNTLTRNDLVVALGGGVCGDMAGFASSMYLRGIDFVQIPTSLLAQVDSSVGGKTAVDLPQGKNLCGAFHQPSLVIIDPNLLLTLDNKYISDGMAEVIKMGCIKSINLFEKIENFRDNGKNPKKLSDVKNIIKNDIIEELIYESVKLKAVVVENDEKEKGERALLNFGHTIGHAIEKIYNFTGITHGEAVGIGMVEFVKYCEKNNISSPNLSLKIAKVLEKFDLKTSTDIDIKNIISEMSSDKKNTGKGINFIAISEIGKSFIYPIKNSDIYSFFE